MYSSTMAAAGAIQRRHLLDGGIKWLLVKPRMCSIGQYRRIRMVIEITSTFPAFFVVVNSVVANNLR
jgi:hypothetical protein